MSNAVLLAPVLALLTVTALGGASEGSVLVTLDNGQVWRQISGGQLLLRVEACGICRTDLHVVEGELPLHRPRVVPGPQVAGVVDAVATDLYQFPLVLSRRTFALAALGRLWTAGVRPDWSALAGTGRRGPLPAEPVAPAAVPPAVEDEGAGETARALAQLWGELLGVEPRPDDDFFLLGGDSLMATRLIAGVRGRFGVEMRLRTLFQTRTLAAMARWIDDADPVRAGG